LPTLASALAPALALKNVAFRNNQKDVGQKGKKAKGQRQGQGQGQGTISPKYAH
jgi:hypothetical protein